MGHLSGKQPELIRVATDEQEFGHVIKSVGFQNVGEDSPAQTDGTHTLMVIKPAGSLFFERLGDPVAPTAYETLGLGMGEESHTQRPGGMDAELTLTQHSPQCS
jgi:hypothetical protein